MKIALWIIQSFLGFAFAASGCMKLFAFDQFAKMSPALADQHGLVIFIGISEVAGATGLILPLLTGILPILTAWAALGLATIMVLATGFHLSRGEYDHLPPVVILLLLASFTAYGRAFLVPPTVKSS